MKRLKHLLLAALLALVSIGAAAQTASTEGADLMCPNSHLFGSGIVSKVCWSCLFPISIGRVAVGGTSLSLPDDRAQAWCLCPGRLFGYPTYGVTLGMWAPTYITELTRAPFCSPTLGASLAHSEVTGLSGTELGTVQAHHAEDNQRATFLNFHFFKFPVSQILDRFRDSVCVSKIASDDTDLVFASEISPLWQNDELAFYVNPESSLLSSPAAIAACAVDAVQSTAYKPNLALWWCAGSWGLLSPYSGHAQQSASPPRESSLLGTRGLATLHRLGILKRTYGDSAVCSAHPWPTLPKQQYRFQTVFPVAEVTNNHWIGASTFRWGEWRNLPAPGVDQQFVYLTWQYTECCMNE